jgi:thymidylate synthase ThyX
MGLSRLAVESVEGFRLASFTEKSQRYIRLGRDFHVPEEIARAGLKREFKKLLAGLAVSYRSLYDGIRGSGEEDETAKEDARYLMPLSTTAQFGMTLNARELEYMISRLASHPLAELREFSSKLYRAASGLAPSLIKYPEPTEYFMAAPSVRDEIRASAGRQSRTKKGDRPEAALIGVTENADERLAASLIFSSSGLSYSESLRRATRMGKRKRRDVIEATLKDMKSHDSAWREFETIKLQYEVTLSSSCFAQLKRHRMATIVAQEYLPALGISIPRSVRKAGMTGLLRRSASEAYGLYRKILSKAGSAAEYSLLNAHRRRVLFDINLRELYHFSRLRSDIHAQWEIRELSDIMCRLAEEKIPSGTVFLCGKDTFERRRKELFG